MGIINYFKGMIASALDIHYDNSTSGLTATQVQAAIDEVAASSGGAGLVRVDTGARETPIDGVAYIAADQQGGKYGTVHSMYFPSTTANFTVILASVTRVVATHLMVYAGAYGHNYAGPWFWWDASNYAVVYRESTGSTDQVRLGLVGGFVLTGSFRVDYVPAP